MVVFVPFVKGGLFFSSILEGAPFRDFSGAGGAQNLGVFFLFVDGGAI